MGTLCDSPSWPGLQTTAAQGQHVSRGPCVISASDLQSDPALLPGEAPAPRSKGGIPTVAAPAPDPQKPQRNRVTLCLVWVGYAATDRQRGYQAWLQTFMLAVSSSRNSSWKLAWLSSSPPSRLCPNAHHCPHLHHNPAPHTIVPSLGFFDFIELITTWHFPLPVCSD